MAAGATAPPIINNIYIGSVKQLFQPALANRSGRTNQNNDALIIHPDFFTDVIARKAIKHAACRHKTSSLFPATKCHWLNTKVMKTELNVANSLVLNRLAGRSKNNNEIVPGFNKKQQY
ncbi:hypothetical protein SEEH0486_14971 [Salmonella enterica subsp. enterica serovar Heidelberg str. 85-0486]|nr:hypothetical protein SEEH1576_16506 [Salmonella enterica subsp. enterica serovar Heidelberg str. 41576]KJT71959.1 hypothetical protein SEEH3714_08785 [Salmonella enterica subsp. enterica serovar Heidelberg str. 622737-14]KJU15656.1 hypothetical protein SEEH0486_14971 [Salmonella enterica subsp. enterica serovar Heidelberg str. 85-0486]